MIAFVELIVAAVMLLAIVIQLVMSLIPILLSLLGLAAVRLADKPVSGERRFSIRRVSFAFFPFLAVVSSLFIVWWIVSWHFKHTAALQRDARNVTNAEAVRLAAVRDAKDRLTPDPEAPVIVDPWGNVLVRTYESSVTHDTVTVRSCGADSKIGTDDDVVAIERVRRPVAGAVKEAAGDLAEGLMQKAKEKLHRPK